MSVVLPPAPPTVIAVPKDASLDELANLKLLSSTFIAKYVVPLVRLVKEVPPAVYITLSPVLRPWLVYAIVSLADAPRAVVSLVRVSGPVKEEISIYYFTVTSNSRFSFRTINITGNTISCKNRNAFCLSIALTNAVAGEFERNIVVAVIS